MAQGSISIRPRTVDAKLTILDIEGELTGNGEEILMDAYTAASANGVKTIGLNFDNLEYMNSSGIGLLVTLLIRVQRNNRLLAIGLNDHYQQIFELTRLDEAILSYPDRGRRAQRPLLQSNGRADHPIEHG
jgi:anti-sigma B factor antagonist